MRKILASIIIGLLCLSSVIASLIGIFIMIQSAVTEQGNLMTGFQLFSLGLILFFLILSTYMISNILKYNELIASSLTNLIEFTMTKDTKSSHPFESLFKNLGSIKMAEIDENGDVKPITGATPGFDIITKLFDIKNNKDKLESIPLENWTIEELMIEKEKAVQASDFEKAARFRDAIENKKKNI